MKRTHISLILATLLVAGIGVGVVLASYPGDEPADWEWYDNFIDETAQNFTDPDSVSDAFTQNNIGQTSYANNWSLTVSTSVGQQNSTTEILTWGVTTAEFYHRASHSTTNNGNWLQIRSRDAGTLQLSQRPSEWNDCDGNFNSGITAFQKDQWTDLYMELKPNGNATVAIWNPDNGVDLTTDVTMNASCLDGAAEIKYEPGQEGMYVERVGVNPGQTSGAVAPILGNPSPEGTTTSNPGSFEVSVDDGEFPDDTVTVDIGFEGSVVGTETLNSQGRVSVTMPNDALDSGSHSWWANATDSNGLSTNETFSYTNPQNVTIREERPPHDVINNSSVAIFEDEKDDPFLSNQSVTDGKIELGAVPGGSDFTLTIESPGYNNRTVQLESIFAQGEVFLINKSVQTLQNRFIIQDNTGRFPPEETEIILQHAINQSLYDSGGFAWLDVSGDDLGASEEFVDNLTYEERYRVLVRNDEENETRVLGSHMVELVGTVELTIGTVSIDPAAVDQVGYAVNRTNRSSEPVRVHFDYNDSTDNTNEIWVKMFEYRNESNTLLANTSFNGPFGVLTVSQDVPSSGNDTTWVVKAVAQRDGENVVIREIVGPRESVLGAMPAWLVTVIFMFSIWMVAGIFSQLNGDFGAVVVAGLGGMFWFVGLAPATLGAGVVILALITSAVLLVNERRDGGL